MLGAIVMLAGSLCVKHPSDFLNDTFGLLQHLAVPKSEHSETASFELPRSRIIVTLAHVSVLLAVDFDNQPCCDAVEVDYV